MPRAKRRIVHIECSTPHLYRWFLSQLTYAARDTGDGFEILDETRWSALLAAAEGRELPSVKEGK